MDTSSSFKASEVNVFSHILALKYALAGDLACGELLEQLSELTLKINWADPAFIQFSEEMRAGVPKISPAQEESLQPSLLAVIHYQTERIARDAEAATLAIPLAKLSLKHMDNISKFMSALTTLHIRMRERLHALGADTTEFTLPSLDSPKTDTSTDT